MEQYLEQRTQLINEDRARRVDSHLFNLQGDSTAARADAIVRDIRKFEADSIWSQDYEDIDHVYPGMEFLTARHIIEKTKLFELLCKMPKGALLHAHLDAMVNVNVLLRLALEHPELHVKVETALTSSSISSVLPQFRALAPAEIAAASETSLSSENYDNSWVQLAKARETFDPALGGPEAFDKWIMGALTINPTEAYKTHSTVPKIWKKFSSTFLVSTGLIRFAPVWPRYIREFLLSSVDDGISYVEARINFVYKFMVGADGQENIPHRQWLVDFEKVLSDVKDELKQQGREDEFFGARIIYTTIRYVSPEELNWYLEDCIQLKKEFPHLIAGFDLVGDENALKPLTDYLPQLLAFQERTKELGLDIPFILHAGETLGDGSKADMNLYDAILLGTKRIGHGFSLVKHPRLMEICREKQIALEVCPISNEILRLTSSMPMHPFPTLLNHGVPVALCSDDPAVFGSMGLSYDFFQVLVSSEVTGILTLGEIARKSIEYTTLEPAEKQRALAQWQARWDKFLAEIAQIQT
ncbi:adenosine deaminase, partial [Punctularia strigosozonata HHB-11173 SS5]|uniref:adenosine deaminase n=1 Tax=Punctularia strigosozonata (strain HHB-11173) TaxID=741275 RepID=UPI0004416CBD